MPRYTVGRFLQDREQWRKMQGHHSSQGMPGCSNTNNSSTSSQVIEFKKRRHIQRNSPAIEGTLKNFFFQVGQ